MLRGRIVLFLICLALPLPFIFVYIISGLGGENISYPFAYHVAFLLWPVVLVGCFFTRSQQGFLWRGLKRLLVVAVPLVLVIYFCVPPISLRIALATSPKDGLDIDPKSGKPLPYTGRDRFLRVTFTSYTIISFSTWDANYPREGTYIIHLYDRAGTEIAEKPYNGIMSGSAHLFLLLPGASFEDEATIYHEAYNLPYSGKYRVQIESLGVKSNSIEVALAQ